MMIKDNFVKHYRAGKPTKYEEEKHIGLLFDVFSKGEGVAAFLDEAAISKQTFYDWLKAHKEFAAAYEGALNRSHRQWEAYPLNNAGFNFPYWSMIMRTRFGFGKSRFKLSDKKNAKEMMQAAKEHLDEDKITVHDYIAIVNSAKTQAIIDGECPDEEKVYRPSTREELLEKKALLEGIVEKQAEIKHSSKNEQLLKDKVN